jgi:hypothetical protein
MDVYFWDIGFNSTEDLDYGLVEKYRFSSESDEGALSVGATVFHPGDQVGFNLFNVTAPAIDVVNLRGEILFNKAGSPFGKDHWAIPLQFYGAGTPGRSGYFRAQEYYPHWMVRSRFTVKVEGIFKFRVDLVVTTVDKEIKYKYVDPEMIVGGAT